MTQKTLMIVYGQCFFVLRTVFDHLPSHSGQVISATANYYIWVIGG